MNIEEKIEYLFTKYNELEASSASHTEFIKNHVENHMDWDGHQNDKIAELEKKFDMVWGNMNKRINGEIAELKEQEYLNAGEIRNNKQDFHELKETIDMVNNRIKIFIGDEKLDGKTLDDPYYPCGKEKDSGGEKDIGFDGFLGSNEARKEYLNKKPPEPIGIYEKENIEFGYTEGYKDIKYYPEPRENEYKYDENNVHVPSYNKGYDDASKEFVEDLKKIMYWKDSKQKAFEKYKKWEVRK